MKLLSFGADEDAGEEEEVETFKKKPIYRPERTSDGHLRCTLANVMLAVVDNPKQVAAIPDFVSQVDTGKHSGKLAGTSKEPKVRIQCLGFACHFRPIILDRARREEKAGEKR